jgi:hypothetical protein
MGLDALGIGSIFDFGGKVIDKIFPNKDDANKAKIALMELQQKGELADLDANLKVAIQQGIVNAEEAKSASLFVSGWRPFIGWICGVSLGYNYIFMPFFTYLSIWYSKSAPAMPALETGELTTILLGMLGLGVLRTVEKTGVITKK